MRTTPRRNRTCYQTTSGNARALGVTADYVLYAPAIQRRECAQSGASPANLQLKIDTDGKTEDKTVDVVGTSSNYTVETFGRPRKITIDPNDHVLKNSADLRLRTSIMRGQQLVAQGNLAEALREFQKALDVNRNSSLAHYRIAEVFYLQHNYQAAANSYRDSLNGDGDPRWTEVWSHIQLGKIFDITGQRERAVNEYRQALQTQDNTQGALEQARKFIEKPFEREEQSGQ